MPSDLRLALRRFHPRWTPILAGSAIALGLAACASTPAPRRDPGLEPGLCRVATAKAEDRVTVSMLADAAVLDVESPSGIGTARLTLTTCSWPPTLIVRFHGFTALESFVASTDTRRFACEWNAAAAGHSCTFDGTAAAAPRAEAGLFEVTLPPRLVTANPSSLTLQWVDSWR